MNQLKTLATTLALTASTIAFMHPAFAQQGSAATSASGATGSSSSSGVTGTSGTSGTPNSANASSAAAGGKSAALNSADKTFLMEAAKGGMAELAMSQMAQQKSSGDAAKQFAARMIDDHTKANDELKQLASSKGVTLPTAAPDAAMAKAKKMQGMSGAAFDKRYMAEMLSDHKKVVALFEKQARSRGGDADINAFAVKTLPTLKEHLQMVQGGKHTGMGTGMVMKN